MLIIDTVFNDKFTLFPGAPNFKHQVWSHKISLRNYKPIFYISWSSLPTTLRFKTDVCTNYAVINISSPYMKKACLLYIYAD